MSLKIVLHIGLVIISNSFLVETEIQEKGKLRYVSPLQLSIFTKGSVYIYEVSHHAWFIEKKDTLFIQGRH